MEQIGATAAVLIASAAEELKRQQREDTEIMRRRNNTERSDGSTTLGPKGAFPSSAPPDVSAIAILAEMEDKRAAEEKTATPSSAEAGLGGEELEDEGDDEFPEEMGPRPRSMSEHVEKTVRRVIQPRQHQRRGSGIGERWRSTVIGGSRDGVGSPMDVQCFTCTVGKKPSQAQKYVNDVDEVGGCCFIDSFIDF